jgi:hypothetical protein
MQFVKLEFVGAVASLTLQQAGGNRINFRMREEILGAINSVASSKARVLVIRKRVALCREAWAKDL